MQRETDRERTPLVLIVSQQEWASRSLDAILTPHGYRISRAYRAEQALAQCARVRPDAVFVDAILPDAEGVEVCRSLAEHPFVSATTPIFLVHSGLVGAEERIRALRVGAWDVLGFPLDGDELLLRLGRYVRAKLTMDRVIDESLVDDETGLYSWKGVVQRTYEIASTASRYTRPLTCMVFAVENGEASAEPGPRLARFGDALRSITRRSDVVGRLGRRNLVVLAPDTDPEGAAILRRRIEQRMQDAATDAEEYAAVRSGYFSTTDFRATGLEPVEILVKARLDIGADQD